MPNVTVPITLLPGGKAPEYAHANDAGADCRVRADLTIEAGTTALVPLGFKVAVPDGYELQIRPRSGLSLTSPLRIANAPGTIDSGFRDEVCALVWNSGTTPITVLAGQRICQCVLSEVPHADFDPVLDVDALGTDRNGGFGSTGVH